MTVRTAPRMTPRTVSSLVVSPARSAFALVAIQFVPSELFFLIVGRRRRRVAADRLPAALVHPPHVGQQHAILDHPAERVDPPLRLDRADHDQVRRGGVAPLPSDAFYRG